MPCDKMKNYFSGGVIEMPKQEFIEEHEKLIPQLKGPMKKEQKEELKDVRGYAYGGEIESKVRQDLTEKYSPPQVSYTPPVQNMARGGIAGSPYDIGVSQSTAAAQGTPSDDGTTSGLAYIPSGADVMNPDYMQPKVQFNPNSGLPAPAPVIPAPAAPQRPAPRGSDALTDYLDTQRAEAGKYGPEQLMALQEQIAQERRGLGPNLAKAGGMFADAIMQGVARSGSPGFGASIESEMAGRDAQRLGAFEKAGELQARKMTAEQRLEAMDPRSTLSKSVQQTYAPLLKKLGFDDQMVAGMSAQNISDVTGKAVDVLKAESESQMAAASLGLRQQAETREAKAAETAREAKRTEQALGAAKDLYSKASIFKPSTWGTGGPAQEVLEKAARGEPIVSPAPAAGWKYLGPVGGQ